MKPAELIAVLSSSLSKLFYLQTSGFKQKKYKEDGKRKASISLYSQLPDTPEIQHALEVSQLQSEVHTPAEPGTKEPQGSWEMWSLT